MAEGLASIGAIICGRRTYDTSVPWWGSNGPTGDARLPIFVLTHTVPDNVPANGVYHFVTDGVEQVVAKARETAGDRNVAVMGGGRVIQSLLNAGLIDEIHLQVVPVIFGDGTRLFDALSTGHLDLEVMNVVNTPKVTHLHYRVVR
jgi:dihydrofolate reductase